MARVNVELFKSVEALTAAAGDALGREAQPLPYARADWLRLTERHCPPPGAFLGLGALNGTRQAWWSLAQDGRRAVPYASWYSLRTDPAGTADPDLLDPMVRALRQHGVARLDLYPLEDAAPLHGALRRQGWLVRSEAAGVSWQADTAGLDFQAYWATRPGQLRNTVKRRTKAAGLDTRIHTRFHPGAWADYARVYEASWKGEEGSFPFLRALAEQEGAAGTLRLGLAYKDGQPIAAQLWLVEHGRATIHKLAYDEAFKALSPGTILSAAMFRHVLDEDRVARIDYGNGDEPYKRDWMDRALPLWRLTAYDPRSPFAWPALGKAAARMLVARLAKR